MTDMIFPGELTIEYQAEMLVSLNSGKAQSFNLSSIKQFLKDLLENIMNSVLDELNEVSQSCDYFSSFFKSLFKENWTFSQVVSTLTRVVSSANKNMWLSIPSTMSLK